MKLRDVHRSACNGRHASTSCSRTRISPDNVWQCVRSLRRLLGCGRLSPSRERKRRIFAAGRSHSAPAPRPGRHLTFIGRQESNIFSFHFRLLFPLLSAISTDLCLSVVHSIDGYSNFPAALRYIHSS